jgi:hypothetical protein
LHFHYKPKVEIYPRNIAEESEDVPLDFVILKRTNQLNVESIVRKLLPAASEAACETGKTDTRPMARKNDIIWGSLPGNKVLTDHEKQWLVTADSSDRRLSV